MKKIILILSVLVILPFMVSANGETAGFEGRAISEESHEEMEDLMVKMMTGDLSESEATRAVELMGEHRSSRSSMMNWKTGRYHGMMFSSGMMGAGSFWFWITRLTNVVWLLAGIMLLVFLFKKLNKRS